MRYDGRPRIPGIGWIAAAAIAVAAAGCDEARPAPPPPPTCPEQMVHLSELSVCIDRYESGLERFGTNARAVSGQGRMPATDITWSEAQAACEEAGFRLCTDVEWHFACAGAASDEEGRAFPYGEEYEENRCNSVPEEEAATDRGPHVGGERPRCQSPEGVYDLSGNVGEWIATEEAGLRGVRGGNFSSYPRYAHCVVTPASFEPPNSHGEALGFRCCVDAR